MSPSENEPEAAGQGRHSGDCVGLIDEEECSQDQQTREKQRHGHLDDN
jgi:hypothetical protein